MSVLRNKFPRWTVTTLIVAVLGNLLAASFRFFLCLTFLQVQA